MARRQSQGGNRGKKGPAEKAASQPSIPTSDSGQTGSTGGKVGSDPQAAKEFGGSRDFGAREDDRIERNYVSGNTKASDPGAAQPHSGEQGTRVTGVGGNASGPGSGSGGDIDTDIVGVGTGSGLAQNGPDDRPGPDDSDGSSREFASGPPAKNEHGPKTGKVEGTTVDRTGGDIETTAEGRGADATSRPARGDPDQIDDSFTGEVSTGEASGQDNS